MKIGRRLLGLLCCVLLLLGLACGGSKNNPTKTTPNQPVAVSTPKGSPTGDAVTGRIGAAGGFLATSDGRLTLSVPAGVLSADTTLSIQPIGNNAFGGVNGAFRLGPEGTAFTQPVTLTYQAADTDLKKTSIRGLGLASQDANGYWSWIPATSYDDSNKTVTVSIQHFSDYAPVSWTLLKPLTAKVKVNETVNLYLTSCYWVKTGGDPNGGSGCNCSGYGTTDQAVEWDVQGIPGGDEAVGTVEGTGEDATYRAPARAPDLNHVMVSAKLANGDNPATRNARVYCEITIEEPETFTGQITFDWNFGGQSFTITMQDATLSQVDDGPDETNYSLKGTASITPTSFTASGETFTLTDPQNQAYNQEYGFKVLKTTPPTVRWSFIAQWNYSYHGYPFPVSVNFATRVGLGCATLSDVPVASLTDVNGSYDMECAMPSYGGTATWEFTKVR